MASAGTPTRCTISDCGGSIETAHLFRAHVGVSHEFSCSEHGWLGYFVPEDLIAHSGPDGASSKPIPDSDFTLVEVATLLALAREGAAGQHFDVIDKLTGRLLKYETERR